MGEEKLQMENFKNIFEFFSIENRNIDDEKFLDEEKCEKI